MCHIEYDQIEYWLIGVFASGTFFISFVSLSCDSVVSKFTIFFFKTMLQTDETMLVWTRRRCAAKVEKEMRFCICFVGRVRLWFCQQVEYFSESFNRQFIRRRNCVIHIVSSRTYGIWLSCFVVAVAASAGSAVCIHGVLFATVPTADGNCCHHNCTKTVSSWTTFQRRLQWLFAYCEPVFLKT